MLKGFFAHKKSGERKVILIYPTNTGKSGEHLRLTTLEVSGFRENYVCGGAGRILAVAVREYVQSVVGIQKTDENSHYEALRRMKKAGIEKAELEAFCER